MQKKLNLMTTNVQELKCIVYELCSNSAVMFYNIQS
jgi:hypothetical protein